jgi:hypothetical protein
MSNFRYSVNCTRCPSITVWRTNDKKYADSVAKAHKQGCKGAAWVVDRKAKVTQQDVDGFK